MSEKSNNNGRGFEFAFLNVLYEEAIKFKECNITKNSSYFAAEKSWLTLKDIQKNDYAASALSVVSTLFKLEPNIIDEKSGNLVLELQTDYNGKNGDVRDLLMRLKDIEWEVGISLKHNHFAVKHSRLSKNIDFCNNWFGLLSSKNYWDSIDSIFEYLQKQKDKKMKWSDLPNKELNVYEPILKAFTEEIIYQYNNNAAIADKFVHYLIGNKDFYKIMSVDSKRKTILQAYNINNTLNKMSENQTPTVFVPKINIPTKIVNLGFKLNSKNTVELHLDNGWHFSFRIHNASTLVETSLKFDIQLTGMPANIISMSFNW